MKAENFSIVRDYQKLVETILERNKFEVQVSGQETYDFRITLDGVTAYTELKFYRSLFPKLDLIKKACERLAATPKGDSVKLVLIVNNYITPSLKEEIAKDYGILVWDIKTLFAFSFDHAGLYYELEAILTQIFNTPPTEFSVVEQGTKDDVISKFIHSAPKKTEARQRIAQGKKLWHDLRNLQPGTGDAVRFEKKCTEILKYLFPNDLALWEEQPHVDENLHRFDLLCRIVCSGPNNFWTELASDFHTRYVIFEFKNYTDKIKQEQIYSTEKYLFLTALRSVSFIVTTQGADKNAVTAAKGALKEAGKLIIILTVEDMAEMLELKDKGDEPAVVLRKNTDKLLQELTR